MGGRHIGSESADEVHPDKWTGVFRELLDETTDGYCLQRSTVLGGPKDVSFKVNTVSLQDIQGS